MSYLEAFQIGWSILWRKAAWLSAAGACILGLYLYRQSIRLTIGSAIVLGLLLVLYVFPRIIRHLTSIEYGGFRLVLTRPGGGESRLSYGESLVLVAAIWIVNGFVAAPFHWILSETYQYFVLAFYPIVVAMPLAAYTLVNFPTERFQLDIRSGQMCPQIPESSI